MTLLVDNRLLFLFSSPPTCLTFSPISRRREILSPILWLWLDLILCNLVYSLSNDLPFLISLLATSTSDNEYIRWSLSFNRSTSKALGSSANADSFILSRTLFKSDLWVEKKFLIARIILPNKESWASSDEARSSTACSMPGTNRWANVLPRISRFTIRSSSSPWYSFPYTS